MANLNDKQQKFVREYLIDYNATQAAIRSGYSKKTAAAQAARLLINVNIQNQLSELKKEDAKKSEVTREMIIAEYMKLAFGDARELYNEDGSLKPITELSDSAAAKIAGFDLEEKVSMSGKTNKKGEVTALLPGVNTTKKVKLTDKRAALDSLCKVLGYNAPEKILTKMQLTDDEVIFE